MLEQNFHTPDRPNLEASKWAWENNVKTYDSVGQYEQAMTQGIMNIFVRVKDILDSSQSDKGNLAQVVFSKSQKKIVGNMYQDKEGQFFSEGVNELDSIMTEQETPDNVDLVYMYCDQEGSPALVRDIFQDEQGNVSERIIDINTASLIEPMEIVHYEPLPDGRVMRRHEKPHPFRKHNADGSVEISGDIDFPSYFDQLNAEISPSTQL